VGGEVFRITEDPIRVEMVEAEVRNAAHGAVVTFQGIVRDNSRGHRTRYLEYETYPRMAEAKLADIGREVQDRWGVGAVAIVHRVGRIEVGETAVVVAVGSGHRGEGFDACRYAIDRIKEIVPIWKKEVWEGGEEWGSGSHDTDG
jgi:molybdopterin synthase catalytic subunit